jgi:hypothetical protein
MTEAATLEVARTLRVALETTAAALARPTLDGLLASAPLLESALARAPGLLSIYAEDRPALRVELARLRRALMRCRRLGRTCGDVIRISLAAHPVALGTDGVYESPAHRGAPNGGRAHTGSALSARA